MEELGHGSRRFWRLARELREGKNKREHPLHGRGGMVYDAETRAGVFADHLGDTFTPMEPEDQHRREDREMR